MITAAQVRAAWSLLGIQLRQLTDVSGLLVQTIQRIMARDCGVWGPVDPFIQLTAGLDFGGIGLSGVEAASQSERERRLAAALRGGRSAPLRGRSGLVAAGGLMGRARCCLS